MRRRISRRGMTVFSSSDAVSFIDGDDCSCIMVAGSSFCCCCCCLFSNAVCTAVSAANVATNISFGVGIFSSSPLSRSPLLLSPPSFPRRSTAVSTNAAAHAARLTVLASWLAPCKSRSSAANPDEASEGWRMGMSYSWRLEDPPWREEDGKKPRAVDPVLEAAMLRVPWVCAEVSEREALLSERKRPILFFNCFCWCNVVFSC
mmetsp:Transcript_23677/g.49037  ORF Transcript_23677/g.49037 Transcript_23677/m.49037 type:complete len:204 (-) Transcript_23677:155-766(-)